MKAYFLMFLIAISMSVFGSDADFSYERPNNSFDNFKHYELLQLEGRIHQIKQTIHSYQHIFSDSEFENLIWNIESIETYFWIQHRNLFSLKL